MKQKTRFRVQSRAAPTAINQQKLLDAMALHQQGRIFEAKTGYEAILNSEPNNFDALHLCGLTAYQSGNLEESVMLYGRAVEIKRNFAPLYSNYGLALQGMKQFEAAIQCYNKAIGLNPMIAEAYLNRGVALKELSRLDDAILSYDQAIAVNPAYADAYFNRANAFNELGRWEESLASYTQAIAIKPHNAEAYMNCGVALRELGRDGEAMNAFLTAVKVKPDYAEAWFNVALTLHRLERFEDAIQGYENALRIKPDYADAHDKRGIALHKLGRTCEALRCFDTALGINPQHSDSYLNRGVALQFARRFEDALESLERALELKPDYAEAHLYKGVALKDLNRLDEALQSYERAIALKADYADAHWNKSLVLLALDQSQDAWRLYEWRKQIKDLVGRRDYPRPLWTGDEDLNGKRVLVYWEQGLGDTIQFCRYLAQFKDAGARVLFAPQKQIRRLMGGLEATFEVVDDNISPADFDYHAPMLSLPLAFKTDMLNIPARIPYLKAEKDRVAFWRDKIGRQGFKIGICWQGSTGKVDSGRSFSLAQFHALSQLSHVRLISLHKGAGEAQLCDLPNGMVVETLGEGFDAGEDAFLDSAAVMTCCDLVITSDTAVAHLAGALGVRTWVALQFMPDWRWLLKRSDSPWYPTMRLFRQTSDGDWETLFMSIKDALVNEIAIDDATPGDRDVFEAPEAPVSWGELIDKITILEIKSARITSQAALANIHLELELLMERARVVLARKPDVAALKNDLTAVNEALWEIEDQIRDKEALMQFDAQFIELARSVYKTNDRRAAIKRVINERLQSRLVEEKSYAGA